MKKNNIIDKIIPPTTRIDREGFSNHLILSELNQFELREIESELIKMLFTRNDYLIGETLVHLNSVKSIDVLRKRIKFANSNTEKIKWASFIADILNGDYLSEQIAFKEFSRFEFMYEVQAIIFYDLIKFKSQRINKLIKKYVDHKYFLVAHHSKIVLNYNGYADDYDKK